MADEIAEAGNKAPSDGDLRANAESQAPESASRGDQREPEDWKRKYLEAKAAEERANQAERKNAELERQLAELREESGQTPAARDGQPAGEPTSSWSTIEAQARAGEPYAQSQIALRDELSRYGVAVATAMRIMEIEDPAVRKRVKERVLKSGNFDQAFRDVQIEDKEAENQQLRERLAEVERQLPKRDVVRTEMRDVPVSELAKTGEISGADYDRRLNQLWAEGNDVEARKLQRLKNTGQLRIRD